MHHVIYRDMLIINYSCPPILFSCHHCIKTWSWSYMSTSSPRDNDLLCFFAHINYWQHNRSILIFTYFTGELCITLDYYVLLTRWSFSGVYLHNIIHMYVVARIYMYIASMICINLYSVPISVYVLLNRRFIPLPPHIDYQGKLKRFTNILNHLVSTDMDFTQLDAYLTSQMRKRQVWVSAARLKIFLDVYFFFKYTSTHKCIIIYVCVCINRVCVLL